MTLFVVDTNVAIAANGGVHAEGDIRCHLSCAERLEGVVKQDTVAIDSTDLIMEEYGKALSHAGGPGMGDAFFKQKSFRTAFARVFARAMCRPTNIGRPIGSPAGLSGTTDSA